MAKLHRTDVSIEQLINDLRSIMLKWNTSAIKGKIVILFEENSVPDIRYHAYVNNTDLFTDFSSETVPNSFHSNIDSHHDQLTNRPEDSNCSHYRTSSQPDYSYFPKYGPQDSVISDKRIDQKSLRPITTISNSNQHNLNFSPQFSFTPDLAHSHYNNNNPSPLNKVALPPFEKIMETKTQVTQRTDLINECDGGIQLISPTCFNEHTTLHDVMMEGTSIMPDVDGEVSGSQFITHKSNYHDRNEVNYLSQFVHPIIHEDNAFVEEETDVVNSKLTLSSLYNTDGILTRSRSPVLGSMYFKKNGDKSLVESVFENEMVFDDQTNTVILKGCSDAIDLTKLNRGELIKVVSKILQIEKKERHNDSIPTKNVRHIVQKSENLTSEEIYGSTKSHHSIKDCMQLQTCEKMPVSSKERMESTGFEQTDVSKKINSKGLDNSSKYIKTNEAFFLSNCNQNVKPLKKRARLCTQFRTEPFDKPEVLDKQNVSDGAADKAEQNVSKYFVKGDYNDHREKNTISDEKIRRKSSLFTCKSCMKNFTSRQDYRQHLRTHDGSFKCNVCGKIMKTKDSLYHHQRGLHSKEKPYHCKECNIPFNFYHSYKLHLQRHKGERPHKCKFCEKRYLTLYHLKEHMRAIHSNTCIVCHVCGKRFSYNSALKLHLNRHSGELPHKCSLCPKKFATKQALKMHAYSHIKDRNFQCETCGKCFKSEYSRNFHSRSHKRQMKRFMCDVCGKTFLYKCILDSHVQIHSMLRPHVCNICNKTFKSKAALYTHKYNVHKDGLMYSCTLCEKSFKSKSCLTAHMKRHQNDSIYSCSTCGAIFPDKGGLNKHMKTIHLPQKCFICKICGKTGTRADNMRTHVKSHKNETSTSSNPMDFIIEELAADRITDVQNQMIKVRQRSRELKHRSTRKLHPRTQTKTSEKSSWMQTNSISYNEDATGFNLQPPNVAASSSALPFLSQEPTSRLPHNIRIDDNPSLLPLAPKAFENYLPSEHSRSAQYLNYLCQQDAASGNTSSMPYPNRPLTSLLTTINNTAESESLPPAPPPPPPYSFILSHHPHNYPMSIANFPAPDGLVPRQVNSIDTPSTYGIHHKKTLTTLQNVEHLSQH